MTEDEIRRTYDAAQKQACDHEAWESGEWSFMSGSCSCADPNAAVVIAGLLAVATKAARRERKRIESECLGRSQAAVRLALTNALRAVERADGNCCDAYCDVEKLLLAAGGTVPNWEEEAER